MTWQTMVNAPKGLPMHPHKFVALIRRKGFEDYIPVTCYWCYGLNTPRWVFDGWKSGEEPMYWSEFPTGVTREMEMVDADLIVREEWHNIVAKWALRPGSASEELAARILNRIRGID